MSVRKDSSLNTVQRWLEIVMYNNGWQTLMPHFPMLHKIPSLKGYKPTSNQRTCYHWWCSSSAHDQLPLRLHLLLLLNFNSQDPH